MNEIDFVRLKIKIFTWKQTYIKYFIIKNEFIKKKNYIYLSNVYV